MSLIATRLGVDEEVQLDPEVAPVVARLVAKLARPNLSLSKLCGRTFFEPEIFQALWHMGGKVLLPVAIADKSNRINLTRRKSE